VNKKVLSKLQAAKGLFKKKHIIKLSFMAFRQNMKHPNFILGLVSFVLLILGVVVKGNGYRGGYYVITTSVIIGAIHWIWSIADVAKNNKLDPKSRPFWVTMVVIIPPLGGMFYYMMKSKNVMM
jgi:hypothetical protein